jgi:hypothetical protein
MFLKILCAECEIQTFKDEEIDEILKTHGAYDTKKINQNHLKSFLKAFFESQMVKYKKLCQHVTTSKCHIACVCKEANNE